MTGRSLSIVFAQEIGETTRSVRSDRDTASNQNDAQRAIEFARNPAGFVSNEVIDAAIEIATLPAAFNSLASFSVGNLTLFTPEFFGTSGAQLNGAFLSAGGSFGLDVGLSGSIGSRVEATLQRFGISINFSVGATATIQGFGIGFDNMDSGLGASAIQRGNGPEASFSLGASVGISIVIPFDVGVGPSNSTG